MSRKTIYPKKFEHNLIVKAMTEFDRVSRSSFEGLEDAVVSLGFSRVEAKKRIHQTNPTGKLARDIKIRLLCYRLTFELLARNGESLNE